MLGSVLIEKLASISPRSSYVEHTHRHKVSIESVRARLDSLRQVLEIPHSSAGQSLVTPLIENSIESKRPRGRPKKSVSVEDPIVKRDGGGSIFNGGASGGDGLGPGENHT